MYRKGNAFPNEVYYWNIWNLANGLGIKENNRLERRSDLTGVEIKAASLAVSTFDFNFKSWFMLETFSLQNPPYVWTKKIPNSELLEIDGYYASIWNDLQEDMNFTTKIWESVDLNWGTLKDGKWTGMLGMIKRNEVEVAIADISMNPDRGANFDFTDPVLEVKSYAYVPMSGNSVNWTMFLELLHWTVWLSLIALLIILPTVWKAFQLWEFQDKESFSIIFQGCFTLLIQQGTFKPRLADLKLI